MSPNRIALLIGLVAILTGCTSTYQPGPGDLAKAKARDEAMNQRYRATLVEQGFIDWDSPTLSEDERRAIAVAKGVAATTPSLIYLYKVRRTPEGWWVDACPFGGANAEGWPAVPTTGSQFGVSISSDWKAIKIHGGA